MLENALPTAFASAVADCSGISELMTLSSMSIDFFVYINTVYSSFGVSPPVVFKAFADARASLEALDIIDVFISLSVSCESLLEVNN